jgi:Zn finger protein HypA/HybF involved in hydrogenase expression
LHEARLCLSLIALAERRLAAAGAERILALRVEVGEWCGVVPEALAAAFPICAAGTRAGGAELRLERSAGRALVLRDMEVI